MLLHERNEGFHFSSTSCSLNIKKRNENVKTIFALPPKHTFDTSPNKKFGSFVYSSHANLFVFKQLISSKTLSMSNQTLIPWLKFLDDILANYWYYFVVLEKQYLNEASWNWRLMKTIMTVCHVYDKQQNYVSFDEVAPKESRPIRFLKKVMPDYA